MDTSWCRIMTGMWESITEDDPTQAEAAALDQAMATALEWGAGIGTLTGRDDFDEVEWSITFAEVDEARLGFISRRNGDVIVVVNRGDQ